MSEIKSDEPAFPRDHRYEGHNGLTMRDYFAAKAMQGMLANPQQDYAPLTQSSQDAVVSSAYGIADAMIAARSQQ